MFVGKGMCDHTSLSLAQMGHVSTWNHSLLRVYTEDISAMKKYHSPIP